MVKPKVYADFHNADINGRLRLDCVGTTEDLTALGIVLQEGMQLSLYADDLDAKGQPDELLVDGVVTFSETEQCWVAVIDWDAIHHASEERIAALVGTDGASDKSTSSDSRMPGRG
jgi:hypothetical protein